MLDYESRFKEAVIDRFADSYVAARRRCPASTATVDQVPRPAGDRARTGRQRAGDRPLRRLPPARPAAAARCIARARRTATRAISCSRTTREQLEFLRFPLGDLAKAETRELARRFGLAVADKPDSQDICFVPTGRYADVIERLRPGAAEAGEIVDLDGRVLGRHAGIIHFTVGQRRGLGVAVRRAALCRAARCRQSPRAWSARGRRCAPRRVVLRDVNWIGDGALDDELSAASASTCSSKCARARPPQAAGSAGGDDGFEVEFVGGEEGVAPGQACVLYDGAAGQARMLGGGFIRVAVAQGESDAAPALDDRPCRWRRDDGTGRGDGTGQPRNSSRSGTCRKGLCALGAGL